MWKLKDVGSDFWLLDLGLVGVHHVRPSLDTLILVRQKKVHRYSPDIADQICRNNDPPILRLIRKSGGKKYKESNHEVFRLGEYLRKEVQAAACWSLCAHWMMWSYPKITFYDSMVTLSSFACSFVWLVSSNPKSHPGCCIRLTSWPMTVTRNNADDQSQKCLTRGGGGAHSLHLKLHFICGVKAYPYRAKATKV